MYGANSVNESLIFKVNGESFTVVLSHWNYIYFSAFRGILLKTEMLAKF